MTAPLVTRVSRADAAAVGDAVRCLKAGGLVAFPTETVYGLGADATDGEAIARLYRGQGPAGVQSADRACGRSGRGAGAGAVRRGAEKLAAGVLAGAADAGAAQNRRLSGRGARDRGLDSIAVRVPDHPVAHTILAAFGRPIVAPSANRSGHVSPTTAAHVLADLRGRIDLIVDGGSTPVGVESTIVACLDAPMLLRPGGLPREDIERVLGRPLAEPAPGIAPDDDAPLAPGMLASHYAPRTPLRLDARRVESGEALLAFGPTLPRRRQYREVAQPVGARRSDRGGGQSVLASARARCRGRESHRRDADAARRPRRSHQRPAGARGGAAVNAPVIVSP